MSNLGDYQTITTLAKLVGGPKRLFIIVAVGGITIGAAGLKIIQAANKAVKARIIKNNTHDQQDKRLYVVHSDGIDGKGLVFNCGDKYRILNRDKDSILIEKFGDGNNPYFVSAEFLKTVSDFIPDE